MTVNPRRPVTTRTVTSLGNVQPVRGTGGSTRDTGKSAELMTAELAVLRDSQPMTTICTRCGDRFVGLTGESRAWFRAHLADKHPGVKLPRRGRGRSGWAKSSPEDRAEAMVEVEARKAMLA